MKPSTFYITTPIYYVNAKPHIGTLYSTLLADVAARWHKVLGEEVFFLTGTDEHGQKVQEKAESLGKVPKEFVDSMIPDFKRVWALYDIEYDKFIRTTDQAHMDAVTRWTQQLLAQGDIYKSVYEGLYCVPCETFVTASNDSVKDEAGNVVCPSCRRGLKMLSEESYVFKLSVYEQRLLEFYEQHPDFITPKERLNEVISFVKSGLKDLSISRKTVKWGIPFPGDPSHTIYVWGDALNNYITAIGYGSDKPADKAMFAKWWPANVHVMAKDIVRFHAVYWPAFLMAAGIPLPKQLLVHGYILTDNQKMSKSLGNVVDPDDLAARYGIDQVRYYLMRQMPISQDGNFSFTELEAHINADLANNLGNLLNRCVALAAKNNLMTVPAAAYWEARSSLLREKCTATFQFYWEEMNRGMYHIALAELWKFIAEVNAYFHTMQPWVLAKSNSELFAEVISATCHSLYAIGIMLWPVMPNKMASLLAALGEKLVIGTNYEELLRSDSWTKTFTLHETAPLFNRIEPKEDTVNPAENLVAAPAAPQENFIAIEDFGKCELLVGTITSCEAVAGSTKLLKQQVDFGPHGMRQILSGIAEHFTPEMLTGKQGVYLVNLKPRKMMGFESQGMLLCAKDGDGLKITTVSGRVENGTRLT